MFIGKINEAPAELMALADQHEKNHNHMLDILNGFAKDTCLLTNDLMEHVGQMGPEAREVALKFAVSASQFLPKMNKSVDTLRAGQEKILAMTAKQTEVEIEKNVGDLTQAKSVLDGVFGKTA